MAIVYYRRDKSNLEFALDPGISDIEKGDRLATLAVTSLTAETFEQGKDGIQYLIDTIAAGVETRLTPYYRAALLRRAGNAPDLDITRQRLAQSALAS